jgi:hypothetical protein
MSRTIKPTPTKTPLRITMRVVENLKPGEIAWDSLVRGFGVRCQRARKVYILKANISGRPRWFSIGEHGAPWTPDTARAEAQVLWGKIRAGEDLAAVREARRQRATVADLCARYLEERCARTQEGLERPFGRAQYREPHPPAARRALCR